MNADDAAIERTPDPKAIVLLGVSGSIAAYKAVDVARRLAEARCRVQVILTEGAAHFVTPLLFEAITGRPVLDDPWARRTGQIEHVERAAEADLLLVAPASANTLARLAHGLADDVLSATALSTTAPLLLAPAMEHGMWHHPATQANVAQLVDRGATLVGPDSGALASGRTGDGRMADPGMVVAAALDQLQGAPRDLKGKTVLITSGPTWEAIDPVRILSNRSTGAMGIALADEAALRGAEVHLILGPTALSPALHPRLTVHRVESAEDMLAAALHQVERADVIIGAAAVSDFRPLRAHEQKLKKTAAGADALELVENPDIIRTLAARASSTAVKVGFAAETEKVVERAEDKRFRKGLDLVIGNEVGRNQGFGSGETRVVAVGARGRTEWSEPGDKRAMARFIWGAIGPLLGSEPAQPTG